MVEAARESRLTAGFFSSLPMVTRSLFLAVGLMAPTARLVAQAVPDTVVSAQRVKAVLIQTSDVFPPGQAGGFIAKALNGLHFTTRPGVVRREVLIRPGEVYDSAKAAESERTLRSMRIFRQVKVDSIRTDSGLVVRAATQDAFTTRIEGSVDGSLKSNTWWVALNELNLLGTATRVGVRYRKTPDRDAVTTSFQRNRLIDSRIGVSAFYDARSDGRTLYGVTWLPFWSFAAQSSWFVSGEERRERVFQFADGNTVARDTLQRRFWIGKVGADWAARTSGTGYVRAGVDGQVRRDDFARQDRVDTLGHSVSAAVTGHVEWRVARFLVSRDFEGFGRQEDVDLSTVVRIGLGLTPKLFGYRDNGFVPAVSARTGLGWRNGFAILTGSALARIAETGWVDSGSVHLGATVVLKPRPRQMAVFHAAHGWQKNPMPSGEFDLGLGVGPRGFTQHAFTGDRAFLLGAEYRYTVTSDFLNTAGLGLAAFADYGGAWYSGTPQRTGYSVGLGLRFGLTVASDLAPARFDLAYINGTGLTKGAWRLAFGKGFVFSTSGRLDR